MKLADLSNISFAKITLVLTIFIAFAVVIIGSISVSISNQNRIIMGVQNSQTTLAGLTRQEAHDYFNNVAKEKLAKPAAVLSYKDKNFTINPQDIKLTANVDDATEKAYSIGRDKSWLLNLVTQLRCALFGQNVSLDASYDEQLLAQKLQQIKTAVDRAPKNATVQLNYDGTVKKTNSTTGLTLETDSIVSKLDPDFRDLKLTVKMALEPDEQAPAISTEDVAAIDSVLGSYTTTFRPGDRGYNIGLAASHLQGAFIRSQASLSFNQVVGKRTREAGYRNAGVIIAGEPAIDVGGGVCQVSSTLYNAILLAGLTPTARTNHFIASSYVPAGRDATVADDLIDFTFKNPLAHPVYLVVGNTGNALTIYVLGCKADLNGKTISLVTEGSSKQPSLYRIWKQNGQVIEREFLHTDSYS